MKHQDLSVSVNCRLVVPGDEEPMSQVSGVGETRGGGERRGGMRR